jgi:hypothetical protein
VVTHDVTPSLNVYYKNTRIKQYHKENRALRTETTINNTYDFRIGRRLHNLPKLRQIGFAANRLIEVGRFAEPRTHALLHALILFRQLAQGFRAADLRQHLAALSGSDPGSISPGAVTYQLRRLRLHRLIERLPNSFRHRVTDVGLRVDPELLLTSIISFGPRAMWAVPNKRQRRHSVPLSCVSR